MDTNLCVIRLGEGERISDALGKVLDTPDTEQQSEPSLFLKKTQLNFTITISMSIGISRKARRLLTLRTADGQSETYRIGPGDLVVTPKGVEHGHTPDDVVKGVQWVSVIHPDARRGHLHRIF